jgi:hypothetical protein
MNKVAEIAILSLGDVHILQFRSDRAYIKRRRGTDKLCRTCLVSFPFIKIRDPNDRVRGVFEG